MVYYYISHKRKVIINHTPKCCCESIRYLFLDDENKFTKNADIWYKISGNIVTNIRPFLRSYDVIYIVRNPFYRLVSGYIDKMIRSQPTLKICRQIISHYKSDGIRRVTFEQFVNFIIRQDKKTLDEHFKPQVNLINLNPDFNFKIYQLEKDKNIINDLLKEKGFKKGFVNYNKDVLKTYFKKINIMGKIHDKDYQHYKQYIKEKIIPNYEAFYTNELIIKVFDFYKDDFIKLGYFKY